jgi:hypothetical protein
MTLSQSLDQSFGDLEFFLGEVTEKLSISKVGDTPGTLLAISLWWLECVDDELSTFAVKLSLSLRLTERAASVPWEVAVSGDCRLQKHDRYCNQVSTAQGEFTTGIALQI